MSDDGWRARIRWVVVHPGRDMVLVARPDGVVRLPETELPGRVWTADPSEVLPGLRELLGADAVLLRCLDEDTDDAARVQRATLVAVPRGLPALPDTMAWAGAGELAGGDGDAAVAARVASELGTGGTGVTGRPWADRGWFDLAEAWLLETMAALGRPVTGPPAQVRAWELSCVLRAPTAGGDVWFKTNATLPLFVNEGVVLGTLSELFGDRVPVPVAVDPERGWMVLDDVGPELGWEAPLEVVEEVASSFARLQVEAAGQTGRLLAGGCNDRRLGRLAAQAEAWLPDLEATGDLPGIDDATWLSGDEQAVLQAALPQLRACCEELAGLAVPPSLVHGDLHLGNVARGPGGYRFFDWTDACVAHPFLDLATIRRGTSFAEGEDQRERELRERLVAAYLPEWAAFEAPERLARAVRLATPLGALHQAVSYRSIVASQQPPIDVHMRQSTAWWLRQVLAGLAELATPA
jgi:hypothetical protein